MKLIASLLLLLFVASVHAEIYTWKDENGKTHFGDSVPKKYMQEADDVQLKMYQPSAEDIEATKQRAEELRQVHSQMNTQSQPNSYSSKSKQKKKQKKYDNDKDRQMAEYNASKACFQACQVVGAGAPVTSRLPDGSMSVAPGRRTVDQSRCGHCKNVKKPSMR